MRLRRYESGDAAQTLDLFLRAIRETAAADYSPEQIAAWARDDIDLGAWHAKRALSETLVATMDGSVVGFTDLDHNGYIDMMFVDPAYGRLGIASALLGRVLDLSEEQSIEHLTVHASLTARPFFERHGFLVLEERHPVRNGVRMTNFLMVRRVPGT